MQWEVCYALRDPSEKNPTSTFASRSDVNNLKIVVNAGNAGVACQIVESMFGGRDNCRATYAYPVNS